MEDKKSMKKRVGFSPDDLEAMIMALNVKGGDRFKEGASRNDTGDFIFDASDDGEGLIPGTASYDYGMREV
jgi:hypothetical protein